MSERKRVAHYVVGEFGPVYQNAEDHLPNWEHINDTRFAVLETQLGIYAQEKASWSLWLYKGENDCRCGTLHAELSPRYRLPGHDVR
jgi:hypothetical protein